MADLARVLPRHWDGRRLLRFLTGLAMLALAFSAPAFGEPATFPAPVSVAAPVSLTVPHSVAAPVSLPAPLSVAAPGVNANADAAAGSAAAVAHPVPVASTVDRSFGELSLPLLPSTLVVGVALGMLAGVAPLLRAPRAPPAV